MDETYREFPPRIGEQFAQRKDIKKTFGGDYQKGIVLFPSYPRLNVFSDDSGPYPDYVDQESGVIEYRGQGLQGKQKLQAGNKRLEEVRLSKEPIRFWRKPVGGVWKFETWAIVTDRSVVLDRDKSGEEVDRILWFILPVESENKEHWNQEAISSAILDLPQDPRNEDIPSQNLLDRYWSISELSEVREPFAGKKVIHTRYLRRRQIRELVIARSNGTCENETCTGMPPDVGRKGEPLLQVDHIVDLGKGGLDTPSNMIAICPNCHAAKTHGSNAEQLATSFQRIVKAKESEMQKTLKKQG